MTRDTQPGLDERTVVLVSVAKRQWERTFDAISEPLMIIDADYVIRRANLALADDQGVAIQRLVGRRCHDVRAESAQSFPRQASSPCDDCPVAQAKRSGAAQDGDMRSDRGRVYRLRAYPLEDEAAALTVCSYRDVTEERELTRQLSNAEKLAAIGRLAGGVAHEINNPLGGILAFTQILLREEVPAGERREYLLEIEKSALRCKGIVESLLKYSRQNLLTQRGPVVVAEVVGEAVALLHYKFAVRDVNVFTHIDSGLPPVQGNANQIEQVLVNLLSNAFDGITASASGKGRIDISARLRDRFVEIDVIDDGTGIEEAHLPRIFDPFFTTKEEGKGTGLGLAVTYAIVSEHGGRISARNLPSGGAGFSVLLPCVAPEKAPA